MNKATGMVRRLDSLGRIVIPMEIRRTMGIHDNDHIEIYTGNDGEIILRKYSFLMNLSSLSEQYADILCNSGGHPVAVCDHESAVSIIGFSQKAVASCRVSSALYKAMSRRKAIAYASPKDEMVLPFVGNKHFVLAGAPIVAENSVFGYIMFLSDNENIYAGLHDQKLIEVAAAFLGRSLYGGTVG